MNELYRILNGMVEAKASKDEIVRFLRSKISEEGEVSDGELRPAEVLTAIVEGDEGVDYQGTLMFIYSLAERGVFGDKRLGIPEVVRDCDGVFSELIASGRLYSSLSEDLDVDCGGGS